MYLTFQLSAWIWNSLWKPSSIEVTPTAAKDGYVVINLTAHDGGRITLEGVDDLDDLDDNRRYGR